jgi:hypothetical protein
MPNEMSFKGRDLTGEHFGRLTVIGFAGFTRRPGRPNQRFALWNCLCDCGNQVTLIASKLYGNTNSCGCLQRETVAAQFSKHGKSAGKHPLYYVWQGMIQRCTNPNHHGWKYYGRKGVKVCTRWHSFVNFLADMEATYQPGLTLHRKHSDAGYTPENTVWATWKVQNDPANKISLPFFQAHCL